MRERRARSDDAAADLLGTYLLAGLTIVLASGLAILVGANLAAPPSAPRATFEVAAAAGSDLANVTHAGGEALALADVRVEWRVADAVVAATLLAKDGPAGATTWLPGEALRYRLPAPVADGGTVTVRVSAATATSLVAVASRAVELPTAASAPPAPSLTIVSLAPATAPADGSTPVTLRARIAPANGLALLDFATVDLTPIGLGVRALADDGLEGDAVPADGEFAARFTVPSAVGVGNYAFIVRAAEAGGALASQGITLGVTSSSGSGGGGGGGLGSGGGVGNVALATKVTTGIAFTGLPSSANVTKFRVSNLTWDQQIPGLLQNDIMLVKVTDRNNRSWTADVQFEPRNGQLAIRGFDIYSAQGGCSWTPPQSLILNAPIDLLHPPDTGALGNPQSNSPLIPGGLPACTLLAPGKYSASYANAGLTDPVTVTVLRLGENTGADEKTAVVNADFSFG